MGSHGNVENVPEADAIVDQIAACMADSRYANATMGAISLQGGTQARLIERKLHESVDAGEIEKRRLICGDSYAFQGDERDIVFLSMVAAATDENGEGRRIGILSDSSARQRFNVAVSRARDQLWLFHTADLHTLSDKCIRRRLLSYMLNPVRTRGEEKKSDSRVTSSATYSTKLLREVITCGLSWVSETQPITAIGSILSSKACEDASPSNATANAGMDRNATNRTCLASEISNGRAGSSSAFGAVLSIVIRTEPWRPFGRNWTD